MLNEMAVEEIVGFYFSVVVKRHTFFLVEQLDMVESLDLSFFDGSRE